MRWLRVELIYACATYRGAALVAAITDILNKFESGNYANQTKGVKNVKQECDEV